MKVEDAMTRTVVSVREDTPFKEIAEILIDKDISAVPVVDELGCVTGVVTEADLIAKEAYPGPPKRGLRALVADIVAGRDLEWLYKAQATKAWDVMTPRVVWASPGDDLHAAARKMLEQGVKRLVVIEDARPVGIISRSDILRVLAQGDGELEEKVKRFMAHCGFVEPDYTIQAKVSDGIVKLEGSVLYEGDIRLAGSLVETIDGVVAVENWLLYRFPDPDRKTISQAISSGPERP